jgi:hypothetical protein
VVASHPEELSGRMAQVRIAGAADETLLGEVVTVQVR